MTCVLTPKHCNSLVWLCGSLLSGSLESLRISVTMADTVLFSSALPEAAVKGFGSVNCKANKSSLV